MNLQDLYESTQTCPECGGPAFSDLLLAEKKDACYSKVRSRYKVWPSAYASGALVQCRKKGAANWGNKSKNEDVAEADQLPGTPVVSLKDLDDKDTKKNRYGQTVPKKLKKDDPRVKFHKDTKQQGVAEGLADDFMKMAQAKGYNVRKAGTPEQERERTQQMLAQRAADREAEAQRGGQEDFKIIDQLRQQYADMLAKYKSLGGANWQYADREQNLTDAERAARAMEPALRDMESRISRAVKYGSVSEASQLIWKKPNQIRGSYTDQELRKLGFKYSAQFNKWGGTESQWAAMSGLNEVSDQTLINYLTAVHQDSQKHSSDPTKRSPQKRNKSVAGFSRAFNKLDARQAQELAPRVGESTDEDRQRYEQAARDVVKGADPDHIARIRKLDSEILRKHVAYAWEKVNRGEYKLNRPDLQEHNNK